MKPYGQHPDDKEPPKAVAALLAQVDADGGRVLAVYREPVGGHWQAFCLLPLDRGRAHPLPARPLARRTPSGCTEVVKKIDRFVDPIVVVSPEPGRLLDAERPPPPHGAREAQGRVDPRDPGARARGGVPDPGAQHREGAQPEGEVARGDPHVPGPRRGAAEDERGALAFQFESPHFVTLGHALRGEPPLRRRRLRADPEAGRQVPEGHASPKTLEEREERAAKVQAADEALARRSPRSRSAGSTTRT